MDIRGKHFVVIGGAGLIGSHTIEALLSEDVGGVIVFDNFSRGSLENLSRSLEDPRVRVFDAGGDIRQTDVLNAALSGAHGVFHFAALWLLQCQDFPRSAFEVNVGGAFNVFEACVAQGVKRLVWSSSASVYGDALSDPMTEDHPFNNTTFYGATKIAGEAMIRALHHRFGLPYLGLRYMNVYGPRQDYRGTHLAVMMNMLNCIHDGQPLTIHGDGSQSFDFIAVEDCAAANICAMKADTVDRHYNVGTGIGTTILQLADMLVELTGTDPGRNFLADAVPVVRNRIGCPDRAREEIGFSARIPLREGLKALVDWWKNDVSRHARQVARV